MMLFCAHYSVFLFYIATWLLTAYTLQVSVPKVTLLCIHEILHLNSDQETGYYSYCRFSQFSSVSPGKFWNSTLNSPQHLHSLASKFNIYSSFFIWHYVTHTVEKVSLSNHRINHSIMKWMYLFWYFNLQTAGPNMHMKIVLHMAMKCWNIRSHQSGHQCLLWQWKH
jgi:hypothetical protein